MGNCLGKKSRTPSKAHVCAPLPSVEIDLQPVSTMEDVFSKEIQSVPADTSPSPSLSDSSFSTFSDHSTSFSSEDQLILSSSSSDSAFSPSVFSHCNRDIFHQSTISHHCQTLSSIIDDLVQQESIRIHRRTKIILIEHLPLQSSTTKLPSFMLANATYNLMQICFRDEKKKNLFGYISPTNPYRIRQTMINNSKLTYSSELDVEYIDMSLVQRVPFWPEEIRSTYEQRIRFWPSNVEHFFDQTCFIRYTEELSLEQQPAYVYAAIEGRLVRSMSDGQIRFASMVWNYLSSKTCGEMKFRVFKHTLFYFFEQYAADSFIPKDLFSYLSYFMQFLWHRLQIKSIPHYFDPNDDLFEENISIPMQISYSDLQNSSNYHRATSAMYLYRLMYLIQFQSNFIEYFSLSKRNLTQTILDIDDQIVQQLSSSVNTHKQPFNFSTAIKSCSRLTLDHLYRYEEENVRIILDYRPLIRLHEPSLILHSLWTIFVQYFNSLFDELFIS